ncbi:MAG: DUF72 domain-containing protein [bacterium]
MAELRIGTCSWKYDSWKGLIYPEKPRINHLKEYAAHYDTVEIDQWFWSLHGPDKVSLPRPDVVRAYVDSVPENFKFSVKVPNSITLTHFYRKSRTEPLTPNPHFLSPTLMREFVESLAPMGDRLGPLMLQFEYLNRQKIASQDEFLDKLGNFMSACPDGFTYCVETRNPTYLNTAYFDFLARKGMGHVFLQGYYMPSIFETYREMGKMVKDLTVIRLHGPDRRGIEAKSGSIWNKIIEPKDAELARLKAMLQDLLARGVSAYLNVNNHYEGSAPLTIEKIQSLLD